MVDDWPAVDTESGVRGGWTLHFYLGAGGYLILGRSDRPCNPYKHLVKYRRQSGRSRAANPSLVACLRDLANRRHPAQDIFGNGHRTAAISSPGDDHLRSGQAPVLSARSLPSRSGVRGPAIAVIVVGGSVRIAVIVASCPLSQPPATLGYLYKSSLRGHDRLRLTVVVGVVIGVTVGLTTSSRWSVVSAAVVIALANMVGQSLMAGRMGNIPGCWFRNCSRCTPFRWTRMIEAS